MSAIRDKIIAQIALIEDLPVQGQQFLETQSLIKNKMQDASTVARIIEKDVWLMAKLLKTANSIYYSGRYGEIRDLQQAISRLGMDEVCRISLAFKAMGIFTKSSSLISMREFWNHSIGVALVTRNIAEVAKSAHFDPGEAYIAGLLHDIGILILDIYFNSVYMRVRASAEENSEGIYETEKKLLEIDHGEIGGLILERWNFPTGIVNAVTWHNAPDHAKPEHLALTQLIHLSDFACSALGASEPGDALPRGFSLGAWYDLKLDTDQLRKIIEDTEEEIEKTKILFNMQ